MVGPGGILEQWTKRLYERVLGDAGVRIAHALTSNILGHAPVSSWNDGKEKNAQPHKNTRLQVLTKC